MQYARSFIRHLARRALHPALKNDQGVSAIEFAIIAPVFMVFTFGVIVYGFYFATLIGLEQAVAEGARAAVRGLTTQERINLANTAIDRTLNNYSGLINELLVIRTVEVDPLNPALFHVRLTYDFSAGPFGDFGTFVPLPNNDIEIDTVVSNGGY